MPSHDRKPITCSVETRFHRLSSVRGAHRIIAMDKGRIVEQGSHNDLLARRGAYWEMTRVGV